MAERKWTPEQKCAIETRGKNLLVAAAAGSGKTAVLVQRIISMLLGGECDVDELLVVTFTHAAAEEMQARIEAALLKKMTEEQDSGQLERLERQLMLLQGASIATIDSFCQSVLRRNFAEIDLDPQFRVAGEEELRLIRQDVMEELFRQKYEQEKNEAFLRFTDDFGGDERGDDALYELVLRIYRFSQSQPFPEEWLRGLAGDFDAASLQSLPSARWYPAIQSEIRMGFARAKEEHENAVKLADELGADFYGQNLQEDAVIFQHLEEALKSGCWQKLYEAFSVLEFGKLKSAPRGTEDSVKVPVKTCRDSYKEVLLGLKDKYFLQTEQELLEDLKAMAPSVGTLAELTLSFLQMYAKVKREKCIVDFSDMEHFALEILSAGKNADGRLLPSETAQELQQKYKAVMVDEYQDTNGVQEAILQLVTRPEKRNLFAVGDVKQSIYRFRLADPALFLGKYRSYRGLGTGYDRIDLSRNFRSRPEVLAAINFIFAQVMTEGAAELSYGKEEMLYPGAGYGDTAEHTLQGPVELHLITEDGPEGETGDPGRGKAPEKEEEDSADSSGDTVEELKGAAREAQLIADRLQEISRDGTLVYDSSQGTYRSFQWRDAVILLRSVRGVANEMLETLRRNNIPAYASMDAGYFQAQEIRIMLALLTVLNNARQDIPLAAVLLSPIGGMTARDLAELRLTNLQEDLYTALHQAGAAESGVAEELKEKAARFVRQLSAWRKLSRELSVPELIWQLYRDTGYYDYVGGLPGGLLRQANLRMLVDRAAAYEKTNFRGLFRFLRFVERMQEMDTDLAAARVLGESENVVRIMSIHKSKGLEFPVVFVASLGRKFNLRDASMPPVLIHRELGLGPYRVMQEEPLRYPTVARYAISHVLQRESKAEELRILYVALTRARERLILIGTAGKQSQLEKKAQQWCRYADSGQAHLPDHAVLGAGCYLDWILPAVARHPDGAPLREITGASFQAAPEPEGQVSHWQVKFTGSAEIPDQGKKTAEENAVLQAVQAGLPLPETSYRDAVEELLDWKYDARGLSDVPAKMTVTELKRRFAEQEQDAVPLIRKEQIDFRTPDFLRTEKKKGLTGMEYGTLMHSVMQHLDLNGDLTLTGITGQLDRMLLQEILLPEEREAVREKNIAIFFQSELGRRLCSAAEVYRELPFSRILPFRRVFPDRPLPEKGEAQLFTQGVLDALFRGADGKLVLLDYKTDSDTDPARARKRYQLQIDLYSEAVEDILGEKPAEQYLYMLHDGTIVEM